MGLKLVGIGGLGLMLSPSARHLVPGGPASFVRIHDRGTEDPRRNACRQQWRQHGAELVSSYEELVGGSDFDGVVICAGKNGDDCKIIGSLLPLVKPVNGGYPFFLHLSTVSSGFVEAAHAHLSSRGISYVNYPLTGGPAGAESATMLILASGDHSLYRRLEPALKVIGTPRFFGPRVTAGAEVKLIGQLMVFNGLIGICSAAALKAHCFGEGLSGIDQAAFFDFLNEGAGGTRQWQVGLSKGIRDNTWDQGFMIHHAVVDAIYAAELCRVHGLPEASILPVVSVALCFAYLLKKYEGRALATHAVVRELLPENAGGIDSFVQEHLRPGDVDSSIRNCIEVLPERVRRSVMLDVVPESFMQG